MPTITTRHTGDMLFETEVGAHRLTVDVPTRLHNLRVVVRLPHADLAAATRREAIRRVAEHCPVTETIATVQDVQVAIET